MTITQVAGLKHCTAREVRLAARSEQLTGPTPGLALGYVQANLVAVPKELAFDFLLFCQRNPRPCPLLDVTEPGSPIPETVAPDADVRTDCPRYCVYRRWRGQPKNLHSSLATTSLLPCSAAHLPLKRHLQAKLPYGTSDGTQCHVSHQHSLSSRWSFGVRNSYRCDH